MASTVQKSISFFTSCKKNVCTFTTSVDLCKIRGGSDNNIIIIIINIQTLALKSSAFYKTISKEL